jgi:chromosome segregation ATPase
MSARKQERGLSGPAERHERPNLSGAASSRSVSEETRAKLDELQDQLGDLQESLLLTNVQDDMEGIQTTLSLLPPRMEQLRTRGYVFRSFLERKVGVLAQQWEDTQSRIHREVSQRTRQLTRESEESESVLRVAMAGGSTQVGRAEAAIKALEHKVDAAHASIRAMYDTLRQNVNQTQSQIEQIEWLLDQVDEASFELYPAEGPVAACKGQLMETKKDGPDGVLYLTDERLIFEQKEKKATKKVLFVATEKEEIQELIFAVPIGQIEEVKASQKGFMGRKEMMELLFTPEADLSEAVFRLRGADNEDWAGMIGRVKSGEIARERTRPKDEAAMESARAAPTKCPTCGAALDVEIVRGMREITCAYCGTVIRL